MYSDYAIYIRSKDGVFRDRIVFYTSLTIIEKLNDPGSWSMQSRTPERCPFMAGDGIVVYKNGVYYYSGILTSVKENYDGYDGQYTWEVKGASDIEFLRRRICYIDPETGDTDSESYYEDTGSVYSVVKNLIDKNVGPSALSYRQEPLIDEVPLVPSLEEISISLRLPNLLQTVAKLLDEKNQSIAMEWDADRRKLTFSIKESNDLSHMLLFSTELNSVISINYLASAPEGNFVMSGGQGEMEERAFAYAQDDESISEWGRIEDYRDVRSVKPEDLQTDADTAIIKNAKENVGYSAVLNTDSAFLQYRRDWNLGDYVGVVVHGETIIRRVMQVETRLTHDRETVTPTIGTVEHGTLNRIFKELSKLRSDVDHLEWSNS